MKTIHKITLGIALAIAVTSTCIISAQAKGNIKEMLLSQNVEAISSGEGWFNNILWQEEWWNCTFSYYTIITTSGTYQLTGSYDEVKAYCNANFSSYSMSSGKEQKGQKKYCKGGKTLCWSRDCR